MALHVARSEILVVLSAAKDPSGGGHRHGMAGVGRDRAAPAALLIMIRRFAPVRRWSEARRLVIANVID